MEKIQSTISTMKIGYHLIDCPFKYHLSYLNDNLDYSPPDHISITLFCLSYKQDLPWYQTFIHHLGGQGGFDYTLKVANVFDNVITNNNTATFTVEQLELV